LGLHPIAAPAYIVDGQGKSQRKYVGLNAFEIAAPPHDKIQFMVAPGGATTRRDRWRAMSFLLRCRIGFSAAAKLNFFSQSIVPEKCY